LDKVNVLVFPAGGENALEIYEALRYNLNVSVYGASGKSDHACYLYPHDRYFEGDYYIDSPTFISSFNALIEHNNIDVVIPTHDTIALFLAQNREQISAKILTADARTASICREKKKLFELFKENGFCPRIYASMEEVPYSSYPVFIKPNIGEGGKGSSVIHFYEDGCSWIDKIHDPIICEYLPGDEITVDCFTNRKGERVFSGVRSRERVQNGLAFRSTSLPMTSEIIQIAEVINNKLNMFGAWFFQAKKDAQGKYRLLEVSCRQAGTMTLYRHKGINFALLGVFEIMGVDTTFIELPCCLTLDRSVSAVFKMDYEYDTVYMDFDDTIALNNQLNTTVIKYLYQCVNQGKKLVLLTRHKRDIEETLNNFRLSSLLFNEIIQFGWDEEKTDFIEPHKAIFIDNSFLERKKVYDMYKIPVFDVDAVTALLAP